MNCQETITSILSEIENCLAQVKDEDIGLLIREIQAANAVYVDGKGRSGLPASSFAMRLGQMGYSVYIPSGVTTPPIREGSLLIICSGSGETEDLVCHAKTAKKEGAKVILITTNPDSSAGQLADQCILLKARSKWQPEFQTIQPMGSTFEQGIQILFDAIIVRMMEQYQISNGMMQNLHNNLE